MQRQSKGQASANARAQRGPGAAVETKKRRVRHFYDYSLLFAVIFITAFGLIMIYSSSQYMALINSLESDYYFKRQLMIAAAGLVIAVIISKIDYRIFRLRLFVYGANIVSLVLLAATQIMGIASHGRTRWIEVAGISFQPTELAKASVILFVAYRIWRAGFKINDPERKEVLKIYGWILIPAAMIASQNLSSGIIVVGIATVMVFVASKNSKPFYIVGIIGVLCYILRYRIVGVIEAIGTGTGLLQGYQMERILSWLYPEQYDAYQTMQGLYAIGSGGLTGQGLGESLQKLGPLPEAHNDMIFPIICEELGLFGAVSVILIFLFIIYRCMLIANNAPDLFGSFISIGVMAHISIQVVLNIAVVTNSIPNTGVTLPFISYGGTAVLILMAEIGLVLSVSNRIRLES